MCVHVHMYSMCMCVHMCVRVYMCVCAHVCTCEVERKLSRETKGTNEHWNRRG